MNQKKDNEKVVLNNIANKYGNVHQKNHPIGNKLKFEVVNATENHEPKKVKKRSLIEKWERKVKMILYMNMIVGDKSFVQLKNKNEPEEEKDE